MVVMALAIGLALSMAPAAQAALVGYWTYDNGGNLGQDSSPQGNDLVASGTPTQAAGGGVFGSALELNGTNAILVPSGGFPTGVPTGGSSYTVSTWFNPDSAANNGGMVGWGNYGSNGQTNCTRMNGTNRIHAYWWNNDLGTPDVGNLVTGNPPAGWHHVINTYNASTTEQRIYIDGVQVAARTAAAPNVGAANFAVGKTFGTEYFDGRLDDTAIYDTTISANQARSLGTGHTQADNLETAYPLVALYRFENAAQIGRDDSDVRSHLTAYGDQVNQDAIGRYGSAVRLGGSDDWLGMAGDTGGDFGGLPSGVPFGKSSYTIAAWIKPDADALSNAGIVGWGNYGANTQTNAFRLDPAGLMNYWWYDDITAPEAGFPGFNLKDGAWHHVIAMYDQATGLEQIFVDGILRADRTAFALNVQPENFRIGTTNGLLEDFKGAIDDLAIFNRALTFAELQRIMAGDFSTFVTPEPATLTLLGLGGLALLRRRRRQA